MTNKQYNAINDQLDDWDEGRRKVPPKEPAKSVMVELVKLFGTILFVVCQIVFWFFVAMGAFFVGVFRSGRNKK